MNPTSNPIHHALHFFDIVLQNFPSYFPSNTQEITSAQLRDFILDLFLQGDLMDFTWDEVIQFLELP